MSKPAILQVGPYPEWDQTPLDAAFEMHRWYEAADKAAFLAQVGPHVRAIATRGDRSVLACRYSPPGNIDGRRAY